MTLQPSRMPAIALSVAVGALALAAIGYAALASQRPQAAETHFADAGSIPLVLEGKGIYMRSCASCHGRRLQGQPLWQLMDEYAGRRAPAFDETGHSWQHPDEDLFHITKFGRFAQAPADYRSYMPAFKDFLGDDQIIAVLAFVKARLPLGLRISQATLNPGNAGMPPNADDVDWRLPPTCNVMLRLTQ